LTIACNEQAFYPKFHGDGGLQKTVRGLRITGDLPFERIFVSPQSYNTVDRSAHWLTVLKRMNTSFLPIWHRQGIQLLKPLKVADRSRDQKRMQFEPFL
jgi:hypothetical protein